MFGKAQKSAVKDIGAAEINAQLTQSLIIKNG